MICLTYNFGIFYPSEGPFLDDRKHKLLKHLRKCIFLSEIRPVNSLFYFTFVSLGFSPDRFVQERWNSDLLQGRHIL